MKLVINSNILISALIKNSITRKILLNPKFEIYLPEFSLNEIRKYLPEITKKANVSEKTIEIVMNQILENIHIVPLDDYKDELTKAIDLIGAVDEKDVPFLALALSITNDGIWSNDKHFKKQNVVITYSTEDIVKSL